MLLSSLKMLPSSLKMLLSLLLWLLHLFVCLSTVQNTSSVTSVAIQFKLIFKDFFSTRKNTEWLTVSAASITTAGGTFQLIVIGYSTSTMTIEVDPEYQLPLAVSAPPLRTENQTTTALREAEVSVTEMLAEGFVLGKDLQGAETAVLLLGSTIVDLSVSITRDSEYQLPPAAATPPPEPYQVGMAEDEQKRKMIDDFAQIHLSASLAEGYEPQEQHSSKPVPAKGLIL